MYWMWTSNASWRTSSKSRKGWRQRATEQPKIQMGWIKRRAIILRLVHGDLNIYQQRQRQSHIKGKNLERDTCPAAMRNSPWPFHLQVFDSCMQLYCKTNYDPPFFVLPFAFSKKATTLFLCVRGNWLFGRRQFLGSSLDLKETIHAGLWFGGSLEGFLKFFDGILDSLWIETHIIHQKFRESFRLTFGPFESRGFHHFMLIKQTTSLNIDGFKLLLVIILFLAVVVLFVIVVFVICSIVIIGLEPFVGWRKPIVGNLVLFSIDAK